MRAFWVANVLQALAFGVLHMNIIQGSYAFALGILQGWVFWRTGKLGYAMLLHFALNASSYLVAPLAPMVNVLPTPIVFAVFGACLPEHRHVRARLHVSDALPEVEVAEDDEEDGAPADDDAILGDVLPTDDAAARASAVSTGLVKEAAHYRSASVLAQFSHTAPSMRSRSSPAPECPSLRPRRIPLPCSRESPGQDRP